MALLALAILAVVYAQGKGDVVQQGFTVGPPFDNIDTRGDAAKARDWISLTLASGRVDHSVGRMFYQHPIRLIDPVSRKALSFNTTFVFQIVSFPSPADGMAFFMVPNNTAPPPRADGGFLGLVSRETNGNSTNQMVAVEFDTYQNNATIGFPEPEADHIGLDINGLAPVNSTLLGGTNLSLLKNSTLKAWVNYDGDRQQIDVWMSINGSERNRDPILTYQNLDLSRIIADEMYVGFSAATGSLGELHRLLSWSFTAANYSSSPLPSSPTPVPILSSQHKRKNATVKIVVSVVAALSLFAGAVWLFWRRWYRRVQHNRAPKPMNLELTSFSYKELYSATRGFSSKEILGRGGSGSVYRGILPQTGSLVAVKALTGAPNLAESQFLAELSVISRVRHQNLVALRGWCHEKEKLLLVYEHMPNGSLDHVLFSADRGIVLSWTQRCNIMKGVAEGLAYMHEGLEQRIVHRDVKAANVLLDEKMGAKLGDFGLAKLMENTKGAQTMTRAGTIGYIAPELAYTGRATERSDVYSFGILVLEVVCGRQALALESSGDWQDRLILLDWVWRMHEVGDLSKVVDPRIMGAADFSMQQALMFTRLGLLCSFPDAMSRPTMRKCCQVMDGDGELPSLPEMRPRAVSIDLFGESSGSPSASISRSTVTTSSSSSSTTHLLT